MKFKVEEQQEQDPKSSGTMKEEPDAKSKDISASIGL